MSAATASRNATERYRAHGIELACGFPLLGNGPGEVEAEPFARIAVVARPREVVETIWAESGTGPVHQTALSDGSELTIEQGSGGDHLVRCGEHLFHISSDVARLTCTRPEDEDPRWQRLLLDWVTYTASVLAGMEAIHASAVEVDGGVIAFAAVSGGGKTTLAAEFAAAGASFFCDDVLTVSLDGDRVLGYPGAPFANLDSSRRDLWERLGSPLASFGDEVWVSVDRPATEPSPIAAVILLDRREDGPERPEFRQESFMALRNLAIGLPHVHGREGRRFSILAALAEKTPLLRVSVSSVHSSRALMDSISKRLEEEGAL